MRKTKQWAIAAMAAAALGLAGCGGGGDSAGGGAPPAETPSAIDAALAAVAAAGTAPAVDKAVADAEAAGVSLADYKRLETAANARKAALAKAARAGTQLAAVKTAAGEVDTTDLTGSKLAAAETAIAALKAALDVAADIADADRTMYQKRLTDAQTAVDRQKQLNGVMTASMNLTTALTALSDAGSAPTAAQITAAKSALTALKAAITAGKLLNAVEKATYNSEANQAQGRIASADTLIDAEKARKESERVAGIVNGITDAEIAVAMTAVGMVTDTSDEDTVTDADNAIAAARTAITNADIPEGDKQLLRTALAMHEGSLAANKASRTAYIRKMEDDAEATRVAGIVKGIEGTEIKAVETAVGKVTDTSDDGSVTAAGKAIAAAKAAIESPDNNLPAAEISKLKAVLAVYERMLTDRETSREAAMNVKPTVPAKPVDIGTVAKIQRGIKGLTLPVGPTANREVTVHWLGVLGIDLPHDNTNNQSAMTPDSQAPEDLGNGWFRYTYNQTKERGLAQFRDGTFKAEVTMYHGLPKEGKPFIEAFREDLTSDGGVLTLPKAKVIENPANIHITDFTTGINRHPGINVRLPGAFQGVRGVFQCARSTNGNQCAVRQAAERLGYSGLQLGEITTSSGEFTPASGTGSTGGTWTFIAEDVNQKVTTPPLSRTGNQITPTRYGFGFWSIDMDDGTYTIGSMPQVRTGNVDSTVDLESVEGTASYSGISAGMYALPAGEGRLGDAGRFDARARFTADFTANTISGTIDEFKGYDGMPRDWEVELKSVAVDGGGHPNSDGDAVPDKMDTTAWTVGGKAAGPSGTWVGDMTGINPADSLPERLVGSFYTEHGLGRMIGGFGAIKTAE